MSKSRTKLIDQAFDKLDKDHSNIITTTDLMGVYDHTKHPKYNSGEWNKMKVRDSNQGNMKLKFILYLASIIRLKDLFQE